MLKGITVGCGFFGRIHLDGWRRVEGARIVAVVDVDARKAKKAAEDFDLPRHYADLEEAIERERPDFVDIATRPDSHLALVEVAASRGCHVLCQKPMAPTWEESVEMVRVCKGSGVRLMINENWRWQPWYREIRKLLEAGTVGEVHTITIVQRNPDAFLDPPFPRQPYFVAMERFLLIESVIHPIDVVRFLGGDIEEVYCDVRRVSGVTRGEDNVCMHLRLKGGGWGLLYSTRCSEEGVGEHVCDFARIEGRDGFVELRPDGRITVKPLFEPAYEHIYHIPEVGYRGDSCRAALQHFVDCLNSGGGFETEGEDYLHVMRVVFAGYQSASERRAVRLG